MRPSVYSVGPPLALVAIWLWDPWLKCSQQATGKGCVQRIKGHALSV